MDTQLLRQQIVEQRTEDLVFIRYMDNNSRIYIETVAYFLKYLLEKTEVKQFELWSMEQMWQELLRCGGDCFSRSWHKTVEVIDWRFTDKNGHKKVRSCCFRPDGLLAVYEEVIQQGSGQL